MSNLLSNFSFHKQPLVFNRYVRGFNIVGKWFWLFKILPVALKHTWLHCLGHLLNASRCCRSLNSWLQIFTKILLINVHSEELWFIKRPLRHQLNRWVRFSCIHTVLSVSIKPCLRFITEILYHLLHVYRSCALQNLRFFSWLGCSISNLCLW